MVSTATDAVTPVIAEIRLPTTAVCLATTLAEYSTLVIEAEILVPTHQMPLPYLWITDDDDTNFTRASTIDPTVEQVHQHAVLPAGQLYRVRWNLDQAPLLRWLKANEAAVLGGKTKGDTQEWLLKLRCPSRAVFETFQQYCDEHDLEWQLLRLYDLSAVKEGQFELSSKQRETLLTALEMGYFAIPQETSLSEVADTMGISIGAASERLRRGQARLIQNTLQISSPRWDQSSEHL